MSDREEFSPPQCCPTATGPPPTILEREEEEKDAEAALERFANEMAENICFAS